MNGKSKIRWIRVFGFATVYFFIYVTSSVFFMIGPYSCFSELAWYLQNPWFALRMIFSFILYELPRSPMLMLTLFIFIANSFILGLVTDWGLRLLLRKRKQKINRPKT